MRSKIQQTESEEAIDIGSGNNNHKNNNKYHYYATHWRVCSVSKISAVSRSGCMRRCQHSIQIHLNPLIRRCNWIYFREKKRTGRWKRIYGTYVTSTLAAADGLTTTMWTRVSATNRILLMASMFIVVSVLFDVSSIVDHSNRLLAKSIDAAATLNWWWKRQNVNSCC